MTNLTDEELKALIKNAKAVIIVGASNKPERASNGIMKYLMKNGVTVYPVNPREDEVLGVKAYASVSDVGIKPDIVDIFRKSEEAADAVYEAIENGAKLIWLQEGVISEEGKKAAEKAGIPFVMDKCIFKEILRLGVTW